MIVLGQVGGGHVVMPYFPDTNSTTSSTCGLTIPPAPGVRKWPVSQTPHDDRDPACTRIRDPRTNWVSQAGRSRASARRIWANLSHPARLVTIRGAEHMLSLIHISEPTRLGMI